MINTNGKRACNSIFAQNKFLFNRMSKKRYLQEKLNLNIDSYETEFKKRFSKDVCSKISSDLRSYYKTGDLSKINFKDKEIKCDNEDKEYMKDLIELIKNYLEDPTEENNSNEINDKEIIVKYLKHYLPLLIFLIIGILCIFGWIICWIFTCCKCCFCQCFKKPSFKIPCFIITYMLSFLIIIFSIYGLVKSDKAFTGLVDIECSFLKIFDQFLDGEIKKDQPRWIGIMGIYRLLEDFKSQIKYLEENIPIDKLNKMDIIIKDKKDCFSKAMKAFDEYCYKEGKYIEVFTKKFEDIFLPLYKNKTYVLDIIKLVGHYDDKNNKYPDETFLLSLNLEFSEITEITDNLIKDINNNVDEDMPIITKGIITILNDVQKEMDQFLKTFNKRVYKIREIIIDISKYIDKYIDNYVKTVITLLFTFIMLINIILDFLLIFIYFYSSKINKCYRCSKFLFKIFPHILWNALALMMIIAFIIGSSVAFIGKMGEDANSIFSFILSKENFESKSPILLGKLKDGKEYLYNCLYKDCSFENEFGIINSVLDRIYLLDELLENIDYLFQPIKDIKDNLPSISLFQEQIKNRTKFLSDNISLYEITNQGSLIILNEILNSLNLEIKKNTNKNERWGINGERTLTCDKHKDLIKLDEYKFHPLICKPIDRDWIKDFNNTSIKDYAIIISEIVNLVNKLNDNSPGSFINKLNYLNQTYNEYLDSCLGLKKFLKKNYMTFLTNFKKLVNDGHILSFMNFKFIAFSIKIFLNNLKNTFGQNIYMVGLSFIIIGCSLSLSISLTIFIIIIINDNIKNEEKRRYNNIIKEKGFYNIEYKKIGNL